MSVIGSNVLAGASGQAGAAPAGYAIERSLRFNSGDSAYLNRTPSSAGNRKTWTWAGWVKRSSTDSDGAIIFSSSPSAGGANTYICFVGSNSAGGTVDAISLFSAPLSVNVGTAAVFRDFAAWFHLVVAVDTTQGTAANRVKIYVNGAEVAYASTSYPTSSQDLGINAAYTHTIGTTNNIDNWGFFNGYLADVHFIDGQALAPTDFGEPDDNGVWQPKAYVASGPNDGTTWSNGIPGNTLSGYPATNGFDGNPSTYVFADNNSTMTCTFSPAITGTKFEIFMYGGGSFPAVNINGTSAGTATGSWVDVSSQAGGSLSTITCFGNASQSSGFTAVRVDGVTLIDGNTSNIGVNGFHLDFSDNSSNAALGTDSSGNSNTWTVNNLVADGGVAYSNYVSGYLNSLTDTATYPVTNLFDGSTSTIVFSSNISGSGIKFVPPTDITGSIELYLRNGDTANSTFSYSLDNGSTFTNLTTTSAGGYVSIGSQTIGNVNGIIVRHVTTDGTNSVNWRAIRVDGTVLTDGTPSNTDSLFDSPTNGTQTDTGLGGQVSGNYATLNPLATGDNITLSNGNLQSSEATVAGHTWTKSTIGMKSGKWYAEITVDSASGVNAIGLTNYPSKHTGWIGADGSAVDQFNMIYFNGSTRGIKDGNVATTNSISGGQWSVGDVLQIAYDADNDKAWFGINNTWYQANGSSTTLSAVEAGNNATFVNFMYDSEYFFTTDNHDAGFTYNFGQRGFVYAAPSGFKALNTANLSDPTIADGSDYMDVVTYTGNGSTQSISGLSMSPDLVWIKQRNAASDHNLFDIVRGVQKRLFSNSTAAEATISTGLTAFNSDGWTMGSSGNINGNNNTYVGWAWDAGTSTVSNTDGSITSQVRANPSAGFSIVSYTAPSSGAFTVGHGLNAAPEFIITKSRSNAYVWGTYHISIGNTGRMDLNSTAGITTTQNSAWNNTSPTSTVFSMGSDWVGSSITYVAYCFAPVEGYSAFGSYTGNGSTDGPFVYTGFRPRWIMIKKSTAIGSWAIIDAVRGSYNIATGGLFAESSNAEDSRGFLDILSNGFKVTSTIGDVNQSGQTHIVAAFAENPFKYARAR